MKIYLVRHGESTSDIEQKYDGDYDDHLTKRGVADAHKVADRLVDCNVQMIFTSEKIRAQETARIMQEKIQCSKEIVSALNEQDIYNAFPDLSKDKPEEEYRRLGELLAEQNEDVVGVEAYTRFKKRVINWFEKMLHSNYDVVAIVTHGGPIRCIIREFLESQEVKKLGNGAIVELNAHEGKIVLVGTANAVL